MGIEVKGQVTGPVEIGPAWFVLKHPLEGVRELENSAAKGGAFLIVRLDTLDDLQHRLVALVLAVVVIYPDQENDVDLVGVRRCVDAAGVQLRYDVGIRVIGGAGVPDRQLLLENTDFGGSGRFLRRVLLRAVQLVGGAVVGRLRWGLQDGADE